MTDPRTQADYVQIASLTDSIVVIDREGHRSTFETLADYETFKAGVSACRMSLYDDATRHWLVKEA
ncbi:hypothetical protein [Mesorhizobium sp.]|uniref:hypothetical protein n=1 Tax=Mesorhizobium sp. TaxID=1871066 RepID=UPI000FE54CA2|nr:hypothetical protein [Mesorhizobium sp.]RWM17820.1 MAG: hypothetical protein EOR74_33225 [Mesorhizobium sp.]